MRKGYSKQGRRDTERIDQIPLNVKCRDKIIPVLRALQRLYSKPNVRDQIVKLIEQDINGDSRSDCGREGLDYWHILVLAGVRLGWYFMNDRLQDLSENHRRLRGVMGLGEWDEKTTFSWQRIGDSIRLLSPSTIDAIHQIIVAE